MASYMSSLSFFLGVVLISCFAATDDNLSFAHFIRPPIEAIYQFGDSLADVGNLLLDDPTYGCGKFPYGESYFHMPTGRCSDGLLMIDYFAHFLEVPFLDPYLNTSGNFTHGVNFAVGGAAALNNSILTTKYGVSTLTNRSLSVQLGWFKSHLDSISSNPSDCRTKLSKTLLFMGEIGGNDYNYAFFEGKSIQHAYQMVPDVVETIKTAMKEVIGLGATRLVTPGIFPIGCSTIYLALFKTNNATMYDELQCLKDFNTFSKYHNSQLQQAIQEVRIDHPNVSVVYLDYYETFIEILRHPTLLGFDENSTRKACCGNADGDRKLENYQACGTVGAPICQNPEEYVSWDGVHYTQHTYRVMAMWLMKDIIYGIL